MIEHSASLGRHQAAVEAALAEMDRDRIAARIWGRDHTVWKQDPKEIANRLGWLDIADRMGAELPCLQSLAEDARRAGYTHALLLGMGGSSLAPEVFRKTFGVADGTLDLAVLDSTVPGAVLAHGESVARPSRPWIMGRMPMPLDPGRALFIVSTKSGGTVETFSLLKFFYNRTADALGAARAGEHFVAITDPGSSLADLARQYHFRAAFLADPNIGGRYSALSHFGLAPAALIGMDLSRLRERALACAEDCAAPTVGAQENPGLWLGAILGELAKAGKDKVTLVVSPGIAAFGDWVEQLIAESTGKEGKGILPVVGEPLGPPNTYGDDRVFVHLRLHRDDSCDAEMAALEAAGQVVVRLGAHDAYDLGGQFFLWELAVAVAGHRLGINPFDQPNVESAKVRAREMVAAYAKTGSLPAEKASLSGDGVTVYGDVKAAGPRDALQAFLAGVEPGAYVALQAYLEPTPETDAALQALRLRLRDETQLAVTVGYGPRFLHSTGQLHKGDAGRGRFIQFTADDPKDAPIPDEAGKPASSISFGVLKTAQVLGDAQALRDAGRRVVRFDLGADIPGGLRRLAT